MSKCPYCDADTRPGDNFCLSCGNRLPATPSPFQQVQGDATMAPQDEWGHAMNDAGTVAATANDRWSEQTERSTPSPFEDMPTRAAEASPVALASAPGEAIQESSKFILRSENGGIIQEYPLEKGEITIGRAPNSDILLAKDKLTSRRHATVRFEDGNYVLRDERSANGTFVNEEQLEELIPHVLQDGDRVSIGEHELVFYKVASPADVRDIEDMPTIAVPLHAGGYEAAYREHENEVGGETVSEFGTHVMDDGTLATTHASSASTLAAPEEVPVTPAPLVAETQRSAPASQPSAAAHNAAARTLGTAASNVTFGDLTSIQHPALPDIAPLLAAVSSLDGQIMSMQEQLHATQETMGEHDTAIGQMTNQLRGGVKRVSDRMDSAIADVARRREEVAWADLLQIMEDVQNNPRDIEYVTKLARKARELKKVFEMHQGILNTLAECNSLLRSLLGEDGK